MNFPFGETGVTESGENQLGSVSFAGLLVSRTGIESPKLISNGATVNFTFRHSSTSAQNMTTLMKEDRFPF